MKPTTPLLILLASASAAAQQAPELLTEPAESPAPKLFAPVPLDEAAPPPPVSTKPRLLVLDIVDKGAGRQATNAIREAVAGEAVRSFEGEAVTPAQIKTALDASGLQALVGCESERCMADLGETVDATRILGGSVAVTGDDFIITLLLVEAGTGERVAQEQRKVPAAEDLSYYAAKQLTSLLLTGRVTDPLVPVVVSASEPGAEVYVDGLLMGEAPVTMKLEPGRHELKVKKDGFSLWKTVANVEEAAPVQVLARLVKARLPLWPFTASATLVSAASLGGAAFFSLWAQSAYDGSVPYLGQPADSYLGHPAPDTSFLLEKKATVRERALVADVLYASAATFGVIALGFAAWDLASGLTAEE